MDQDNQAYFIIGKETSNYLIVEILNYEYPESDEYWDANWLKARIKIKTRSFSGYYSASLQTIDFREFKKGLEGIYRTLNGAAQFYSMEEWLTIILNGDGIGHFVGDIIACDFPPSGSKLRFELQIDQTEIPGIVNQINSILEIFPVKGSPDKTI